MKTSPLITKEAMGNELISRNFGKRDEKMKLQTVTYSESNELFSVFKQYMMPTIDGAIGWDEDFQFDGFVENLKRDWFRWLIVRNEKAGLVCFRTIESRIHIHLLIVFHPFQRQGLARQFFRLIERNINQSVCH